MEVSDSTKLLMLRVVIFVLYLAVGTWVFQVLERETQHKNWENSKNQREQILAKYNIASEDIKLLEQASRQPSSLLEWNYGNTFVFSITVITTIGKNCKESFQRIYGSHCNTWSSQKIGIEIENSCNRNNSTFHFVCTKPGNAAF